MIRMEDTLSNHHELRGFYDLVGEDGVLAGVFGAHLQLRTHHLDIMMVGLVKAVVHVCFQVHWSGGGQREEGLRHHFQLALQALG